MNQIRQFHIYIASKTKHASKWRKLRANGVNVAASWIDAGDIHQPESYRELWTSCIAEVCSADLLIVYCEPGETLKGCLVEIGAALASDVPVYCVGRCTSVVADEISDASFHHHPLWRWASSIDEAIESWDQDVGTKVDRLNA